MENPPSYDDCSNQVAGASSAALPPTKLYVAGRFIHSADPASPALYEFSHSVGFLKDSDRSVRVERLEYTVKSPGGAAQLSTRKKHIYDLRHPTPATGPTFDYYAEPTSRQSLCSFGLVSFRPRRLLSSARGYRVHRATHSLRCRLVRREVLFSAVPARDRAVGYEWSDAQGRLVAREVDGGDGLMTLVIGAEMDAGNRDALVSAWMLRVWCELVKTR